MNLKYMPEIDTLYIYFEVETPKIMVPSEFSDQVGIFVDKKTQKKICGYEVEGASEFFLENTNKFDFNLKQLIAAGIYFIRVSTGLSQEKMASELGVSLSSYKSVEKAEQNFTLDTFESINIKFPRMKKIVAENLLAS
jgi:uncharacterized protein YuzE/DNA-binding XRE family transcriptional regulator